MSQPKLEGEIQERIMRMSPPSGVGVIPFTTPVVSFGDFTTSRIATIGINPSSKEFLAGKKLRSNQKKRLADFETLGKKGESNFTPEEAKQIWTGCKNYFSGKNAYWSWFKHFDEILTRIDSGYRSGLSAHLDLSPWATSPIWNKMTPSEQNALINHDKDFLTWQLKESPIRTIIFNGNTVRKALDASMGFHLKVDRTFEYTAGQKNQVSKFYYGDGPTGELVLGWTLNIPSLRMNPEERKNVMKQISDWVIEKTNK
jgi:phage-related protein